MSYVVSFSVLAGCCCILSAAFGQKPHVTIAKDEKFQKFQRIYLLVYIFVMGSDWLQGPYVYALYQQYGYKTDDIALLFVTGFLSSACFGTLVGSFADTRGRKALCVCYCFTYAASCLTKLSPNFYVLMLGRVLAGIATSLLYSVFESWMVCEHNSKQFPKELLNETFAWSTWANGLVAIFSGILANWAADVLGLVGPFIVAAVLLLITSVIIQFSWQENYGTLDETQTLWSSLKSGFWAVSTDRNIASLGIIQSLYEGSMYCFVFMWTPALQRGLSDSSSLPFGWIFASFMVAVMIGSLLFGWLQSRVSVEFLAKPVYFLAALAFLVPCLTADPTLVFWSFIVFEITCGMHWPLIGTLRSLYIPEEVRSAVMNLVRIPLNIIVVFVLLKVATMRVETVFILCTSLLLFTCVCSFILKPKPLKA